MASNNFDTPQVGSVSLDDLMDPVPPLPGKAPNKMARYFFVAAAGLLSGATIIIGPDLLLMVPEYFILMIQPAKDTVSVLIQRAGGDDVTMLIPGSNPNSIGRIGNPVRLVLPGSSPWLKFTVLGPTGLNALSICAMTGYNPNEIFYMDHRFEGAA